MEKNKMKKIIFGAILLGLVGCTSAIERPTPPQARPVAVYNKQKGMYEIAYNGQKRMVSRSEYERYRAEMMNYQMKRQKSVDTQRDIGFWANLITTGLLIREIIVH